MYRKTLFILALLNLIFLFAGCNNTATNSAGHNSSSQSEETVSSSDDSISDEISNHKSETAADSTAQNSSFQSEEDVSSEDSSISDELLVHETEAQYFPVDGTETKYIGNVRFNFWLTIPSDWKAFDRSYNSDGYYIECGNENIDMRVYGGWDVLPEEFYINTDDGGTISEFVFDSGISGWQKSKEAHYIKFFYKTDDRYVTFYLNYENAPEWFEENQKKILSSAKTLRDGYH